MASRRMSTIHKLPGQKLSRSIKDDDDAWDGTDGLDDSFHSKSAADHHHHHHCHHHHHQLDLSEAELKEEVTRVLNANNPHAPKNLVRYSFKERFYKPVTAVDHLAVHFALDGNLLHKDSDEARRLSIFQLPTGLVPVETKVEDHAETPTTPVEDGAESEETGDEDKPHRTSSKRRKREAKITNQFNFSERAGQTRNNPSRERSCQTEPPPRITFSGTANQWEIYDAYFQKLQKQDKIEKKKKTTPEKKENFEVRKKSLLDTGNEEFAKVGRVAVIVERIVIQNTMDDIAQDFKYFEDASDEFRDQEGTLLPLWTFQYEKARHLSVTALCWNNKYQDLFAVGLGSYDFGKQEGGMLLFFSLKNSAFPEYIYSTASGILCLDIHPQLSYLVAVGFYDGCVAVYNLKEETVHPVYKSTASTGKHTDPVWQVRWQNDDMDNNHMFCSVSSDGRVVAWTLVKNELMSSDIIRLSVKGAPSDGSDGSQLTVISRGTSLDFHKQIDYLFLVGTEEGKIYKCSKTYSSQFLETYDAHRMPVDTVKWNHFHPKIFISCSSDWNVKIWDHTVNTPMFTFDLGAPIGDVCWAPYSSTIFAAVTIDRKDLVTTGTSCGIEYHATNLLPCLRRGARAAFGTIVPTLHF
ncbi:dynein, axonemal, intermediate chain 1, paralog 2 isoform X2 [Gambusia affinis]|uniref:dynein, axonemal, intermediate chain 1, paralog 2 isoform X2 n=1 Tax=Gambusia affinis TaxID=33528 RepID=UPI001CDBEA18|nr:dynein, axonemal, intermediate chain 1, paralog 2 isoform X2 [Gambusia affinis]